MKKISRRCTLAFALSLSLAESAKSQISGRPLKLVVPYGVGGAPDILARMFAQEMSAAYGSVIVDNRGGAGGTLGADVVAKAAPNSNTLLVTTSATHVINPHLQPNIPYDPQKDFTPIAMVASTPLMLVTAAQGPIKSVADVLALSRSKPDSVSYASAGIGTMQHIAGALIESSAKVQMTHVPYKGTSQLMPDLLSGRVHIMFNSVAAVAHMVRNGQLRALAVTTATRLPSWPEVPTMVESGLQRFEVDAWYAVFGPRGMPAVEVTKAQKELQRVLDLPSIKERYATLGLEQLRGGPAELSELIRKDGQKWAAFLKERSISAAD